LGIRRDVEAILHQACADPDVNDEKHRLMAEMFTTGTTTEAKSAMYKFACGVIMNLEFVTPGDTVYNAQAHSMQDWNIIWIRTVEWDDETATTIAHERGGARTANAGHCVRSAQSEPMC
jgi:hypothetical protein